MYRLLRLASALAAGFLCFAGCGQKQMQLIDVASFDHEGDTEAAAFAEGCYCNDDFVIELICTEKNEEGNTYNLVLFSKDDGEQKFFGTATGDLESGVTLWDVGEEKSMTVEAEDNAKKLTVTCAYNGVNIPSVCGEYHYFADNWSLDVEEENVYLREGIYRNGEFKLSLYEGAEILRFVITDADGIIVCEGAQRITDPISVLNVEYSGVKIGLAAGLYENKLYIEVADYSGSEECEYSGKYYSVE